MDTTVRVALSFESWNKFTAMRRRRQMNIMAGKLRETLTVNNEGKTLQKSYGQNLRRKIMLVRLATYQNVQDEVRKRESLMVLESLQN